MDSGASFGSSEDPRPHCSKSLPTQLCQDTSPMNPLQKGTTLPIDLEEYTTPPTEPQEGTSPPTEPQEGSSPPTEPREDISPPTSLRQNTDLLTGKTGCCNSDKTPTTEDGHSDVTTSKRKRKITCPKDSDEDDVNNASSAGDQTRSENFAAEGSL